MFSGARLSSMSPQAKKISSIKTKRESKTDEMIKLALNEVSNILISTRHYILPICIGSNGKP